MDSLEMEIADLKQEIMNMETRQPIAKPEQSSGAIQQAVQDTVQQLEREYQAKVEETVSMEVSNIQQFYNKEITSLKLQIETLQQEKETIPEPEKVVVREVVEQQIIANDVR